MLLYGSVLVPPLFVLYRNFATSNIASCHCFLAYFDLHLLTYFVELPQIVRKRIGASTFCVISQLCDFKYRKLSLFSGIF